MHREQRVRELELLGQRPRLAGDPGHHRPQHRGELHDGLLRDDAVLAAPLGDGVEGVEEEVRIEVAAQRDQLRVLGLALQRLAAGALLPQVLLEVDVAREPPAADPEQRDADREARLRGQERGVRAHEIGERAADAEDHGGADAGVDEDPQHVADERRRERGDARRGAVHRKERTPQRGAHEQEASAHEQRQRHREGVAAVRVLDDGERHDDERDRDGAARREEAADGRPHDLLERHVRCFLHHIHVRARPADTDRREPVWRVSMKVERGSWIIGLACSTVAIASSSSSTAGRTSRRCS